MHVYVKMASHPHVLSLSYKYVTQQIYVQQITFISVSLKFIVNRPIMKLDGKKISVFVCWFITIVQFFNKLCVYNLA
jgi:hypothetical protein